MITKLNNTVGWCEKGRSPGKHKDKKKNIFDPMGEGRNIKKNIFDFKGYLWDIHRMEYNWTKILVNWVNQDRMD